MVRDRRDAGVFAAVTAVSAIVTAGYSWLPLLIGWCIGTVILLLLPEREFGEMRKLPAGLILVGGILVLAAAALGAEDAFPEDSTFPFVSVGLLLLVWRAMCGERKTAASTANLLGMILLPMLAVVILFGLKDVSWVENIPPKYPWTQVLTVVAVTSPWWCFRRGRFTKSTWLWYAAAGALSVGMSLLTRGILGGSLCGQEEFPLYRAVQTIRILGILQRMEALLAAVILMGAFAVMLLTADKLTGALDTLLPQRKRIWKCGAMLLTAFLLECGLRMIRADAMGMAETIFWGFVPILALWVVFSEKKKEINESP